MSFSPVTPPKSNRLRGTDLSALRRAPYQSAKKTQYTEEREEDRQRYIYNKSNPSLQRENEQYKEMVKQLEQENALLRNKEQELQSQITILKKEILQLEVYKDLYFKKTTLSPHGEIYGESKSISTPIKGRRLFDSLGSLSSTSSKKNINRSAYYGEKEKFNIKSVQKVEDSLILDDDSIIVKKELFSQDHSHSVKRDSLCLSEGNSFISKRNTVDFSDIHENEDSFSLDLSIHQTKQKDSSILKKKEENPSFIQEIEPSVDFNNISLSGINTTSSIDNESIVQEAVEEVVNPENMNYEQLLQWEQSRGGVLDERWRKIHDNVLTKLDTCGYNTIEKDENNETYHQCCICLCEYEEPDDNDSKAIRVLPCGHLYHRDCIDNFLKKHWRCPFCKFDLMDWFHE